MKDKIFLEQDSQEIYNIIDALTFYKDNAIMQDYCYLIEKQLKNIIGQIEVQGVNIYKNEKTPNFKFGQEVKYEDKDAIIVRMSNDEGFIGIAIIDNECLTVIDVPIVLIKEKIK